MVERRGMLVACDSNVLDRAGHNQTGQTDREALIRRFRVLAEAGLFKLVMTAGLRDEVNHPHTPAFIRATMAPHDEAPPPLAFVRRPAPTAAQQINRMRIRAMVQGNAKPGKHEADAGHLSDAHERGCACFITYDGRLLRKRRDLEATLPGLRIVTLEEFLALFEASTPSLDDSEDREAEL